MYVGYGLKRCQRVGLSIENAATFVEKKLRREAAARNPHALTKAQFRRKLMADLH